MKSFKLKSGQTLVFSFPLIINGFFVISRYGWADDWAFMVAYEEFGTTGEHFSGYRPILELFFNLSFPLIESTEDLSILRAIASIGVSFLAVKIYNFNRKAGYSKLFVLSLALLTPLLPSFSIFARWATVFIYPWVALLAFIAGEQFLKKRLFIAWILLCVCFLTYQPAATFALVPLALLFLKKVVPTGTVYKFALSAVFCFGLSTLVGYLFNLAFGIDTKERASVISNPVELFEKLVWLTSRPFLLSFRPFLIDSPTVIDLVLYFSLVVVVLIALMYFAKVNLLKVMDFSFILGLVVLFFLSVLPLVPIVENQIEFRTLATSSTLGLMLLIRLVEVLTTRINSSRGFLAISLALFLCITTYNFYWSKEVFVDSFNTNEYFVEMSLSSKENLQSVTINYRIDYSKAWPQREYLGSLSVVSDLQMSWVLPGFLIKNFGYDVAKISEESSNVPDIDFDKFREVLFQKHSQ